MDYLTKMNGKYGHNGFSAVGFSILGQPPSHKYSSGAVKVAQARGDFSVLVERERRALRVHLVKATEDRFKQLEELVASVL